MELADSLQCDFRLMFTPILAVMHWSPNYRGSFKQRTG